MQHDPTQPKTQEDRVESCIVDVPNSVFILNKHLYLSGVWLSVDLRTDTKKSCIGKRSDYLLKCCQPLWTLQST